MNIHNSKLYLFFKKEKLYDNKYLKFWYVLVTPGYCHGFLRIMFTVFGSSCLFIHFIDIQQRQWKHLVEKRHFWQTAFIKYFKEMWLNKIIDTQQMAVFLFHFRYSSYLVMYSYNFSLYCLRNLREARWDKTTDRLIVLPFFKRNNCSLTSKLRKTLEQVIKETICRHVDNNAVISRRQNRTVKNKPCQINIEWMTNIVDCGNVTDIIYTDFCKTFIYLKYFCLHLAP